MIESVFMLIPLTTSLIYGENDLNAFLITFGVTLCSGLLLTNIRPEHNDMGKREAILLTGSIWIVFSLFGMQPFLIAGTHTSVTDAFFETMSGFTTTGVSVMTTLESVPKGILMWRCVSQWIGGMGIILFTLAVLPMLNSYGGMQLFNAEVTGITHDKLRPRISSTAKGLWLVYIILTIILILLLSLSDIGFFNAFCLGLSTVSTGGFSTSDMTIAGMESDYVKSVSCIFMFIGGISFALLYKISRGEFKGLFKNDPFKWYVISIFLGYAGFVVSRFINHNITDVRDITIEPLFQSISIISSIGLTEPTFDEWGEFSVIIIVIMMFIGACAGSTSGGAKIDRIIVLLKFIKNEFYKMMRPNAITTVRINGKGTPNQILHKSLAFLFLYIIVIFIGGTILSALGIPLKDSFICTLAAISNTGIGTAATGISNTYELVPDIGKWTLAFIMLIGRLELYTILLLFTDSFWKK